MSKICFGIDVGGTSIKCGVFADSGELLDKCEIPTRKEEHGKYILDDISAFVDNELKKMNIPRGDVLGIGMGIPGSVMDNGSVNKCVNLGWGVVNVKSEMEKKTGILVNVGNDANMAALGEFWKGGGAGFSSVMLITIGTGVGGGIIIKGKPLNGFNGAAAEIGHISVVAEETEKCNCGKIGCLEQVASASGIVRMAKKFMKEQTGSSMEGILNLTAKNVLDAAKVGDAVAERTIEYVCSYLGKGLAIASGIIDPECFLIGGGVSAAGDFLIDKITKYYKQFVFHPGMNTKILKAKLGNDAGMYGAAKLVLS